MALLYPIRLGRWYTNAFAHCFSTATRGTCQANGGYINAFCHFDGIQYVSAIAAGRDRYKNVVFVTDSLLLPGKYILKAVVVSYGADG